MVCTDRHKDNKRFLYSLQKNYYTMEMEALLFKLGCTSRMQDIVTTLPPLPGSGIASTTPFQIGKILATDVGFIYGLATYADGLDAEGNTLISTTQAQNLYVTLQSGAVQFYQELRLSDLLNEFAGSPVVRPQKYTPVNIPSFDLSKSTFLNPAGFFSGATVVSIRLKMYYIDTTDWTRVKGILFTKKDEHHNAAKK